MSEIAVDFLLGAGLSSRLIAWYGNGYGGYSHAAGVLADNKRYIDAHAAVIDGVPKGVRVRYIDTERCVKRVRSAIRCSLTEHETWEQALRFLVGDPYGDADIWAFITGRQEQSPGRHSQGHWICSAAQLHALRKLGYIKKLSVPDHQVTPNSLLLMMEAVGFKTHDMPPIT